MYEEVYLDEEIRAVLKETRVIAMIGASANTERPSYGVMKYLLGKGYTVHPINPGIAGQKLLGQTAYEKLSAVPGQVDMVDIFRNSEAARAAIACKVSLGIRTVWMQIGVRNDIAKQEAEAAGLRVIMNRCPKIEYSRLC